MKRILFLFVAVFVAQFLLADNIVLTSPCICGSATENGEDVALNELKPEGVPSGIYETYMRFQPGEYYLKGECNGKTVRMIANKTGKLSKKNKGAKTSEFRVVRVRYDSKQAILAITPVELYLKGNIVADGTTVEYKGNGVFEQEVDMHFGHVFLFQDKFFYFAFNNDDNVAVKRLKGSRTAVCMPSEGFEGENIRLNYGTYTVRLDMNNYTWSINAPINEYKISAFGSSVCNGSGAIDNKGYAYLYGRELMRRTDKNISKFPFFVSGVSIGGNNTLNLLDRYDEMIHDFGKYVIIGLSMGNEGLHGAKDQQAVFNQFRDNMLKLIDMMESDGKTVVVMNNYARADYNQDDYKYIKEMNRLIHQWNVPSINTLGAIDNGEGKWADGYVADTWHPTTEGHVQFFDAMPPSLFDALELGKPQPVRDMTKSMTLKNGSTLQFFGEGKVFPFTVSVRIKGTDAGRVITVTSVSGKECAVDILKGGYIQYVKVAGDTLTSAFPALKDADTWHDISLTNYYAQGFSVVYLDGVLVGKTTERIAPMNITIGDANKSLTRQYSELSFWRSGMNELEMQDHHEGKMMKSSLEIYSPLGEDLQPDASIPNLAQSLNHAFYVKGNVAESKTKPSGKTKKRK